MSSFNILLCSQYFKVAYLIELTTCPSKFVKKLAMYTKNKIKEILGAYDILDYWSAFDTMFETYLGGTSYSDQLKKLTHDFGQVVFFLFFFKLNCSYADQE